MTKETFKNAFKNIFRKTRLYVRIAVQCSDMMQIHAASAEVI